MKYRKGQTVVLATSVSTTEIYKVSKVVKLGNKRIVHLEGSTLTFDADTGLAVNDPVDSQCRIIEIPIVRT